jgi:hypothetical protein
MIRDGKRQSKRCAAYGMDHVAIRAGTFVLICQTRAAIIQPGRYDPGIGSA